MLLHFQNMLRSEYTLLEVAIHSQQGEDVLGHLVEHVDVNLYSNGQTLLHQAIAVDNVAAATLLLRCGADIHCDDERNATPLHLAKSDDAVSFLLQRGACVKRQRYDGATPLHMCDLPTIAHLLVAHGANVHARTFGGDTPLHGCKLAQKVKCLVDDGGADVEAANANKYTPLHVACSFGRWQVAVALLERNASLNSLDYSGRTPRDVVKAVRSIFVQLDTSDRLDLDRTLATLDVWAAGRQRGHDNKVIYDQLVWHSLRPVCRDAKNALMDALALPFDIVNLIVVQWVGPWAVTVA
ncbi:hypothetical protein DYB30_000534 [Aphanomyces astaci]|uniref:Uncharacterized protein n=1 Tax=Aphanomyces astaci TaxID=112090 RepID=A0A397DLU7_APHAT|nr:hypothetical protein DYB34_000061 [Aphanomyces astaci]RHY64774.1 hypothetical protein DYB30_000534 [Aphanomyces astaci]